MASPNANSPKSTVAAFVVVFGFGSFILLTLATLTDFWIITEEIVIDPANITLAGHNLKARKYSRLGQFRLCESYDSERMRCQNIDYSNLFSAKEPDDVVQALAFSIRIAFLFAPVALSCLLLAIPASLCGYFRPTRRLVASGVLYVLAGLVVFLELIYCISSVNDELSHRSIEKAGEIIFFYQYGWSFYIAALSFVCSLAAGIFCLQVYLSSKSTQAIITLIPGLMRQQKEQLDEIKEQPSLRLALRSEQQREGDAVEPPSGAADDELSLLVRNGRSSNCWSNHALNSVSSPVNPLAPPTPFAPPPLPAVSPFSPIHPFASNVSSPFQPTPYGLPSPPFIYHLSTAL